MFHKQLMRKCSIGLAILALPVLVLAETVGIFFDNSVEQIKFAAGDVKTALASKGFTVENLPIAQLNGSYANQKVVIALASNTAVTTLLQAQGGAAPAGLGEQAYGIRTTTTSKKSFWVLGGDVNGAMYGGLQIAENIVRDGFASTYSMQESPYVKERGTKLNIPMDGRSRTYPGELLGDSFKRAIAFGWDLNFWKEWFDAKARNRFNMVSVWCDHPFTAMVSVPGYEDCVLTDVQDADGKVIKQMTIDQKIAHWRQVMVLAHARGFKFYLVNWNIWTWGCDDKHGITPKDATNQNTMTYMAKSMKKLLETYPDLDGFGVTSGENMDGSNDEKELFLWESYGKPMVDYAKLNPNRQLTFIHRFYQAQTAFIMDKFAPILTQPNIKFSFSVKYANAKLLGTTYPTTMEADLASVIEYKQTTFLTLRTDDLSFLDWGDPTFARNLIKGVPDKNPDHLKYISGWYFGGDNWCPTRTWYVQDPARQNELDVTRNWYFELVWGRLSYNPDISNDVFKAAIKTHYPGVDENALFDAWANASKAFQVSNELITGLFLFDYSLHPETQKSQEGFRPAKEYLEAFPPLGSSLTNAVGLDSAKRCGEAALVNLNKIAGTGSPELQDKVRNIQALACLSLYTTEKIRGAFATGPAAPTALGKAYCYWLSYADLMDAIYVGQNFQRTTSTPDWHSVDRNVLYDYREAVGDENAPAPACTPIIGTRPVTVLIDKNQTIGVRSLSNDAITLYLSGEQGFSVEIFKSNGVKVAKLSRPRNNIGSTRFVLGKKLPQGVYLVRLKSAGQIVSGQINVVAK